MGELVGHRDLPFIRPEYTSPDIQAEEKFRTVIDNLGILDPRALATDRLQALGLVLPSDFFKGPHLHGPHSQAVYDGDGIIASPSIDQNSDYHMEHRVLTTVMQKGGRSSLHWHTVYQDTTPEQKRPMQEIYLGLQGKLSIYTLVIDQGVIKGRIRNVLTPGETFVVNTGEPHYVAAEDDDSYAGIVMRNGGNVPEPQHHIPLMATLPGEQHVRVITSGEVSERVPVFMS